MEEMALKQSGIRAHLSRSQQAAESGLLTTTLGVSTRRRWVSPGPPWVPSCSTSADTGRKLLHVLGTSIITGERETVSSKIKDNSSL